MPNTAFILFVDDEAWQVATADGLRVSALPASDEEGSARSSKDRVEKSRILLRELKHAGEPVVLCLPSSWCLCAQLSTEGLPRKDRWQALEYKLEEFLPISAEDTAADFVLGSRTSNTVLGVGIERQKLEALVTEFEKAGIPVGWICPTALLAVQHFVRQIKRSPEAIICQSREGFEWICLREGRPFTWQLFRRPDDLRLQVSIALLKDGLQSVDVVGADLSADFWNEFPQTQVQHADPQPIQEAAALCARHLVAGEQEPWIDFRREAVPPPDRLHKVKTPLHALLYAVILFLACLSGAFLFRTYLYDQQTQNTMAKQERIFRQLYPSERLPLAMRPRMESDLQRLRGLGGSDQEVDSRPSALVNMYELLRRLPSDLRFRLLDIRINSDGVIVEGQVRTHGDADLLAGAIRRQGGFSVDPPRTEQLAQNSVGFVLSAKPRVPETKTGIAEAPHAVSKAPERNAR